MAGKIVGRKMAEIGKKWHREAGKYFYNYLDANPYDYL
jgi:hypothetical protein